jgi:murein DD-endopeptidase MepM/ murein hydrolase activator NlpD
MKLHPPVKNMRWAKYPVGDVTQWMFENPAGYAHLGLSGHNGIDIVRPHGEHMFAVEDGTICAVKDDPSGYGKHIRMVSKVPDEKGYHRDWVYGHMHFIGVKDGQEVKAGQFVGTMGNTGFVVSNSTGNGFWEYNPYAGTHLHFGVRPIKPMRNGFTYTGLPGKWGAVDYDNGYKGRVDPRPYFLPPELLSSKVITYASRVQSREIYRMGEALQLIGK